MITLKTHCGSCGQDMTRAPAQRRYCRDCNPIFGNATTLSLDEEIAALPLPEHTIEQLWWRCLGGQRHYFGTEPKNGAEICFRAIIPGQYSGGVGPTEELAVEALRQLFETQLRQAHGRIQSKPASFSGVQTGRLRCDRPNYSNSPKPDYAIVDVDVSTLIEHVEQGTRTLNDIVTEACAERDAAAETKVLASVLASPTLKELAMHYVLDAPMRRTAAMMKHLSEGRVSRETMLDAVGDNDLDSAHEILRQEKLTYDGETVAITPTAGPGGTTVTWLENPGDEFKEHVDPRLAVHHRPQKSVYDAAYAGFKLRETNEPEYLIKPPALQTSTYQAQAIMRRRKR